MYKITILQEFGRSGFHLVCPFHEKDIQGGNRIPVKIYVEFATIRCEILNESCQNTNASAMVTRDFPYPDLLDESRSTRDN